MFKKVVGLIKKINRSSDVIIDFDKTLDFKIKSSHLLNATLISNEPITQPIKKGETELIVSFTSYSKRIHDVHLVVESIAEQALKANRLILWLDEDEFTLETIPLVLHRQIKRGLEVRFCPNYKSYKKIIPTLEVFPDANIITIDDDILYPYDMIEILIREHKQDSTCILGFRAHKVKMESNGALKPYVEWEYETYDNNSGNLIFLTSGAGTFFPKACFDDEVLNSNVFMSICPSADDVWLKAMALLSQRKCKKVSDGRDFWKRFMLIKKNQDIGLFNLNVIDSFNDEQIKSVFERYGLYSKLQDKCE